LKSWSKIMVIYSQKSFKPKHISMETILTKTGSREESNFSNRSRQNFHDEHTPIFNKKLYKVFQCYWDWQFMLMLVKFDHDFMQMIFQLRQGKKSTLSLLHFKVLKSACSYSYKSCLNHFRIKNFLIAIRRKNLFRLDQF